MSQPQGTGRIATFVADLRRAVSVLLLGKQTSFKRVRGESTPAETENSNDPSLPPEVKMALRHVGLFSRVAAANGWSLSHVLQVARGKRQSKPVVEAIVPEVLRIEREDVA